jgi:hypothetical protein
MIEYTYTNNTIEYGLNYNIELQQERGFLNGSDSTGRNVYNNKPGRPPRAVIQPE